MVASSSWLPVLPLDRAPPVVKLLLVFPSDEFVTNGVEV